MATNLVERDPKKTATVPPALSATTHANHSHTAAATTTNASRAPFPWSRVATVGILMGGAFASGWWIANKQAHEKTLIQLPPALHHIPADTVVVTTEPISYRSIERTVEAVGTLHGFEEITISSKVEGRVLKIYHDLSNVVAPGELLLELDPTDAKLAVEQAERNVQTELAKWGFASVPSEDVDLNKLPTVVSARLRFELAQSRLNRMIPLQAVQSISEDDVEQAKSDMRVAESEWNHQLQMAKSAAATARLRYADLAIAIQRLRDTEIRVPNPTMVGNPNDQVYSVAERLVSEGTLLRPGTEVFKLVLGRTLKLKLSIPEAYSGQVIAGQTVNVFTSANAKPAAGVVARVSPSINRSTRSFTVEVEVPNQEGTLKPGSFAKAQILVGHDDRATTVPSSALYSFAGINKVFVIEQGIAHEHKVIAGEQTNDWVEIASPVLPQGALVATSGQRLLSEGITVTVRNENGEPTPANAANTPGSTSNDTAKELDANQPEHRVESDPVSK